MYRDTAELRKGLNKILADLDTGAISNGSARVRLQAMKLITDSVKIEIAAANLGRSFTAVEFDRVPLRAIDRAA